MIHVTFIIRQATFCVCDNFFQVSHYVRTSTWIAHRQWTVTIHVLWFGNNVLAQAYPTVFHIPQLFMYTRVCVCPLISYSKWLFFSLLPSLIFKEYTDELNYLLTIVKHPKTVHVLQNALSALEQPLEESRLVRNGSTPSKQAATAAEQTVTAQPIRTSTQPKETLTTKISQYGKQLCKHSWLTVWVWAQAS